MFWVLHSPLIREVPISLHCYGSTFPRRPRRQIQTFAISLDDLQYSLLNDVCISPYHNCLHPAIIFKSVSTKILLQRWDHDNRSKTKSSDNHNQCRFFRDAIVRCVPVAERSKARAYGRSAAGIAGSNPAGGKDGCPL